MSGEDPLVMLNATNAAAGGKVDPATVVAVAKSSQSVDDATTNIAAIAHAGNIVKLYDTMKQANPSQQASGWRGLSPAEQESLKSVGYQPPNIDALSHAGAGGQHGGIWSDISGGFSDALHDVGHVATDVPHAASDALNAAGAPLRTVQHGIRTGYVLGEEANPWEKNYGQGGLLGQIGQSISGHPPPGATSDMWHTLTDPSSWAQAWHETTNGNTSIDPLIKNKLDDQYGAKQVSLALRVADQGANAVVQGAPQAQRQALINQVRDPKFGALVTQVSNARISLGRMLVGSQFINQHPLAGKVLSGGLDAASDILLDPTMQAGKVTEASRVARYGMDASSAADVVRSSKGVDMLAKKIAPLLEQGRYGELVKVDPRLDNIAADLSDMKVDSAEKFKDYLANSAGQAAMFSGRAAKISQGTAIVPHLTYLGWMKSGIKDALSASIDRLADGKPPAGLDAVLDPSDVNGVGEGISAHANQVQTAVDLLNKGKLAGEYGKIPGVSNVARLVRRTSTLVPSKSFITIADTTRDADGIALDSGPDVTNFRRYIQGFLPAKMTDQLSNVFVNSDEGERRQLVTAAIKQNFHAAGLYNSEDSAASADAALAEMDDYMRKQAYSVNGYDTLDEDDGMPTKHALLEVQKAKGLAIPMPSVVRKLVRANGIMNAAGVNPMNGVDSVMKIWRTMILDRPGFAVRMALDENLNRTLRTSPKALIGSFLGSGASQTRTDEDIAGQVQREIEDGSIVPEDGVARKASLKGLANKPLLPYHPTERALQILTDHAPEGIRPHIQNAQEWYGSVFGGLARRWARQTERGAIKAFGIEKYVNAATDLATHQPVMDAAEDVLANGRGSDGFGWSPEAQIRQMKVGGKAVIARFNPRAPFTESTPGDFGFNFKWQVGLDQIANSKLGRAALETVGNDRRTAVTAVKGVLNDPDFAAEKKGFVWAKQIRDGRRVGVNATQDEADTAFARQIVDHVNAHVRSGIYKASNRGPVLQKIVDHMIKTGSAPDMDMLEGVAGRDLPSSVYGPDVVPVHKFSSFFSRSFEEMVGKPMNWMARQPHFIHQYADALDQTRPLADAIKGGKQIEEFREVNAKSPLEDISEAVSRHVRAIDPNARVEIKEGGHDAVDRMMGNPHYVHLNAYSGDRFVGNLMYQKSGFKNLGRIQQIGVEEGFKRQGYATAMWDAAREAHDIAPDRLPDPMHSDDLSPDAEAWIPSLEDRPRPVRVVKQLSNGFRDLTPEEAAVRNGDAEKLASDLAAQRAVYSMIPFIHNPELRTQFEDYHRNLFPFLFAQRQFLARWGRTFADSPSAVRELQLTMNGLRTTGIVQRDSSGDDYFYYPGSQYVTEMITSTLNQIGVHSTVPFMEPFTGQVKYLMPGLANPVTPSVGPFAAVSMKELEKVFPEMAGFNNSVLGQGATEGNVQQFLPTIVNRLYDAMGPNEAGSQLASTMAMGMKYLDATGHGLPNNPTRGQTEMYISRVQTWARSLLVARAMLGFVLPATPDAGLDPAGLDARYKTLLSQLPYEQATTEFIKENPDAVAYTVGSTEGSTEGGLPSTAADLAWTNQNLAFTENYPAAAPWFAPRSPGTFSLTEFQEQLDTGERTSKPIYNPAPGQPSVLTDIINSRASGAYYTTVDNYETAYANAPDSATRSSLTNQYDQWKADFLKRNPIFGEYIASEAGHVSRVTTINQVSQALKDPGLPKSDVTSNLKTALTAYDTFQSEYLDVTGSSSQAYDAKTTMKANMVSWINAAAKEAPDVSDFLTTIIRPEIDEMTG